MFVSVNYWLDTESVGSFQIYALDGGEAGFKTLIHGELKPLRPLNLC